MQSPALRLFISSLIGKELWIRPGYRQASVAGAAALCSKALGKDLSVDDSAVEKVVPQYQSHYAELYDEWRETRTSWKKSRKI
jgi:sugar (pentulose or hexulose) kinase